MLGDGSGVRQHQRQQRGKWLNHIQTYTHQINEDDEIDKETNRTNTKNQNPDRAHKKEAHKS